MEIRIHTQGGSVEIFFQDDPALAARILKGIQSTKVVTGDTITIAGDYSLTTFVASRVNRVDLIAEDLPRWKHPADILDVVELSEDEFRERSHLNDPARLERRRSPKRTGEFAVAFVEVEMTGGSRIFLAAEIKVALEAERLQRLHLLFSAPAVHFRLPQGGTSILNPKNLVRLTFNPGPDVTPIDAWPAHHLSRRQGSERMADAMAGTTLIL
ncbi:MAG: hypothetical protein ACLQM8_12995 [Limisphaerales bacterium]